MEKQVLNTCSFSLVSSTAILEEFQIAEIHFSFEEMTGSWYYPKVDRLVSCTTICFALSLRDGIGE